MNKVVGSLSGLEVSLETGVMAKQANGSVVLKCGDTVLLATATMSKQVKEGIDFFPLTVEFVEKYYAAGKIAGGFIKREARPSKYATLLSRLIDRPLRPSFPKNFFHEVQIVVTLLSYDDAYPIEHLAVIAASAALSVSDIPFSQYVGAAMVADVNGELRVNPTMSDLSASDLDMVVAGTQDAVLMIESGSNELSESRIIDAIVDGHNGIKESIELQKQLVDQVSKPKRSFDLPEEDDELKSKIDGFIAPKMAQNLQKGNKQEIDDFLSQLMTDVLNAFVLEDESNLELVTRLFHSLKKTHIRHSIINQKIRPDGRKTDEIRDISIDIDLLPAAHGSALFTRGETQSLGVVTLGVDGDEQRGESLGQEISEAMYFHYNFPPYSVGECGFMGRTGRREIGHGQLAQRALEPVIPSSEAFPYVIRLVSEILESNGSSSMASVCSGSLTLMSSGVPVKGAVSGIAMGLLMDNSDNYTILSDIQGLEDHYGDMDFKVAGTKDGITALQLDIKIEGLSKEILVEALEQARVGRLHILNEMNRVIDAPRDAVTSRAPRLEYITINPEKVGLLIGPGGKQIKKIEEDSGAVVYVVDGDKGSVSISGKNGQIIDHARQIIQDLVKDVEKGDIYEGKVVKIMNFGAFLELLPGKEALLHISKIAEERVEKVEDYFSVGDVVKVKVADIDKQGRPNLVRIFE